MKIKFPTIHTEQDYLQSMLDLKLNEKQSDRTGVGTSKMFNQEFHFDLFSEQALPILIGKHTGLKSALIELIWIMKGRNDLQWLKDHGVNYWDEWVKPDGTFGPIYGSQMRNFANMGVDQLQNLCDSLINNFDSRRHIISLWDPTTMKDQALPPCHYNYHITTYSETRNNNTMNMFNLHVTQRSGDAFLGVPYDLLMFMYFMKIIGFMLISNSNKTQKIASNLFLTVNDYHLYSNHHNAVTEYKQYYRENKYDKKYTPPSHLNFNSSMFEWGNKMNWKFSIDELLNKIVEEKFDVFNYTTKNLSDWTLPKDIKKIKAKVAV